MESRALGKGLSALISDKSIDLSSNGYLPNLSIDQISPNPHQPRMAIKRICHRKVLMPRRLHMSLPQR